MKTRPVCPTIIHQGFLGFTCVFGTPKIDSVANDDFPNLLFSAFPPSPTYSKIEKRSCWGRKDSEAISRRGSQARGSIGREAWPSRNSRDKERSALFSVGESMPESAVDMDDSMAKPVAIGFSSTSCFDSERGLIGPLYKIRPSQTCPEWFLESTMEVRLLAVFPQRRPVVVARLAPAPLIAAIMKIAGMER